MISTKLITVLLMTACLLAGWIVGSGGQVAQAQDPVETTPVEPEPIETVAKVVRDCHFVIVPEARLDGRPALLDQCSGDTWRFDDGYDFDSKAYVRSYAWVAIPRE